MLDGCPPEPRQDNLPGPGPLLLAWAWTSEVEGGALRPDPFLSELRAAFGLQEHHDLTMT